MGSSGKPETAIIVSFWACSGLVMYLHYYSFYVLVQAVNNSVVAGVSKGAQSAAIFFVNAFLFGHCDGRQSITIVKLLSVVAVTFGIVVYTVSKPPSGDAAKTSSGQGVGLPDIQMTDQ